MNLVIFGLGYSATHFIQSRAEKFCCTATVTTTEKARSLTRPGLDVRVFSPETIDPFIFDAIAKADAVLASVGPGANGDPALECFGAAMAQAPNLKTIVYLSTIGVYGDHQGAWIDETTPCAPSNDRSRWRLRVEEQWLALGAPAGRHVHVLRLAGIYGPGQNALVNLRRGTARRIVKPGQVFNRIHVEDIARAIDACLVDRGNGRIWNISDNEPAPGEDVVTYAAKRLGMQPPPLIDFETATLSPMARSFYGETKRVSNRAMREELGVKLAFPSYREGIDALFEDGDGSMTTA